MKPSLLHVIPLAAATCIALAYPADARSRTTVRVHSPKPAEHRLTTPPVQVGDTFTYDYTTSLSEKVGKVPFKRFFKGGTTTTVESFAEKVSGHAIQFDFFSQGGDIGNQDLTSTLVNFTGPASAQREVVWGYTQAADPTASFVTASPGFSTPYVVDEYPEAGGSSWTSNGANLNEYTVQNFQPAVYYQDGYINTSESGEAVRDDILFDSSAGKVTGTNTDDAADGTGRATTVPANHAPRTTTFLLPLMQGSHYVIPVSIGGQMVFVPDWFPGGAQPPQPISNDSFAITSAATTPKSCGKMGGMSADDLHEMVLVLSVTRGTLAQRDTHFYNTSLGTICRVEQIDVTSYNNTSDGKINGTVEIKTVQQLASSSLTRPERRPTGSVAPFRSDFSPQVFALQVSFGAKLLF